MRKSLILMLLGALWLLVAAPRAAQAAGSAFSGCPPSSPAAGIIDTGCTQHAQGPIFGDMYTVIWGDTVFSISRRFNVNGDFLMQFNGISSPYRLLAGQRIRIPGGGPGPGPTPWPCPTPFLAITNPAPGASVGTTFAVSGSGCGLFEGNVVIRALDGRGVQVGEAITTLSGPNVGAGGQGTYNVSMTVSGAQGPTLTLIAISSGVEYSRVTLNLNDGGIPGQCASSALSILEPAEGVNVPASFAVRGDAAFNCSVTVIARDGGGRQVGTAPPAGTFQGAQWSTTLTLQGGIAPGTDLFIEARTNGGGTAQRRVRFGTPQQPSLAITEPGQNASLSVTFWVRGSGSGLGDGRIVVQAFSDSQGLITEAPTTVGASGQGAFEVQLTVNQNTPGRIEAFNPATGARAAVRVFFNGAPPGASYRNLVNGQCSLFIPGNTSPAFTNPDGVQLRTLPAGWMATRRVVRFANQLWYVIPGSGSGGLDEWVRGSDAQPSGDCGL